MLRYNGFMNSFQLTYSQRLSKEAIWQLDLIVIRAAYWVPPSLSRPVSSVAIWKRMVSRRTNDFDRSITNSFAILNRRMSNGGAVIALSSCGFVLSVIRTGSLNSRRRQIGLVSAGGATVAKRNQCNQWLQSSTELTWPEALDLSVVQWTDRVRLLVAECIDCASRFLVLLLYLLNEYKESFVNYCLFNLASLVSPCTYRLSSGVALSLIDFTTQWPRPVPFQKFPEIFQNIENLAFVAWNCPIFNSVTTESTIHLLRLRSSTPYAWQWWWHTTDSPLVLDVGPKFLCACEG